MLCHKKIKLFFGDVVLHMTNALTMPRSIIRVIPVHPFFLVFQLLFAHYLSRIFYVYSLLFFLLGPVFQFISAVCVAGANCCGQAALSKIFFVYRSKSRFHPVCKHWPCDIWIPHVTFRFRAQPHDNVTNSTQDAAKQFMIEKLSWTLDSP